MGVFKNSEQVEHLIKLALAEDEVTRDVTSTLLVPETSRAEGFYVSKERGVWCGEEITKLTLDVAARDVGFQSITYTSTVHEGASFQEATVLGKFSGVTRELLALERTLLNFAQRLTGIATATNAVVAANPNLQILDTRKTVPGHRVLDKYAVAVGGGSNHRMSLADRVLIKNNHIDASGGSLEAILKTVTVPPGMLTEIEVRSEAELLRVLAVYTPDVIMLDNFRDEDITRAIELVRERAPHVALEVSGGITFERLPRLNAIGGFAVSMGALTNKVKATDVSLRIVPQ